MKKLTANSKLIGCLMGLSIVALGTGCTDSDYDLSSVDSTIGVGGEGLELPTSSTENIILDDVLKLNNSDFVKIAANGDYMFNKDGDEATPSHPYINKIWVEKANVNNNFRLHITLPSQSAGARRTKLSNPVTAPCCLVLNISPSFIWSFRKKTVILSHILNNLLKQDEHERCKNCRVCPQLFRGPQHGRD